MKILLVHNSYQHSGGEDIVFEQERRMLERAGHQVVTYRRSNWEIARYSLIRQAALAKQVIWSTHAHREISQLLRREEPRIVHVHNTFLMVSPAIYSACREARIPVVQTLHNYRLFCPAASFFKDGEICEQCVQRSLWRGIRYGCYRGSHAATAAVALMLAVHRRLHTWTEMVDRYVALTDFARRKFMALGLPVMKLLVKSNFVYPDPGQRVCNGEYALFVGRLAAGKGLKTLLAAWARFNRDIPLMIIGDGPLRPELEADANDRRLTHVYFRGPLARAETLAAMKEARFLIYPSECYENFPMSIVEAFSCGIPVICSRLGAMQEIVADGRTGLHFTPGEGESLAQQLEWAWTHPRTMAEMGREARREYEAKYTAEKNYSTLMEIYQGAMASRL